MTIENAGPGISDARLRSFIDVFAQDVSSDKEGLKSPFFQRQCAQLRKKMRFTDVDLSEVAISSFLEANSIALEKKVRLDAQIARDANWFITNLLWRFFSRYCEKPQTVMDPSILVQLWRFGPGASRGTKATHFFEKISERCGTVTSKAKPLASFLRKMNPYLSRYDAKYGYRFVEVESSKLSTVPKNEKTDRTICTEPLWNMALQLAAGTCIEGALQIAGFDISEQALKNKVLALKGSIDGSLATIDLKWASDLITPLLIESIWPKPWYELFMLIRSSHCEINGESVELGMMSTMGNGFTFPMMTLTLLSLIYACTPQRPLVVDSERYGVFGDDIVVPSMHFTRVCEVLESAGLIVNRDKSFWQGHFRESCGGDYLEGVDITPFYIKSLQNDSEVYSAINSMIAWSSKSRKMLPRSYQLLRSFLTVDRPFLIPEWEDPSSGILSREVARRYKLIISRPKWVRSNETLVDSDILLLTALHGSICQGKGTINFSPRDSNVLKVVRSRLPKGYLDGSVPWITDAEGRTWRDSIISIFFE